MYKGVGGAVMGNWLFLHTPNLIQTGRRLHSRRRLCGLSALDYETCTPSPTCPIREIRVIRRPSHFGCGVSRAVSWHLCAFALVELRSFGPAYPARGASGTGNWDQPKHTTCRGRPIWENPTYSAFWSVFGATCLRLQRLASSVGFGTTAGLGPRKNLPYSGVVTPEP